jgi:hypothetical protein
MTRTWTISDQSGGSVRVVTLAEYLAAVEQAARTHAAKPRLYSLQPRPSRRTSA